MLNKHISEFNHGLHVAIVLNKKREHVATVKSLYSNGGVCYVEAWTRVDGSKYLERTHAEKAGGYGYDKQAAALHGAIVEGFKLFNHCGTDEKTRKILADLLAGKIDNATADKRAHKIGAEFANSRTSLYYQTGLRRLEKMGFTVINA